MKPHLNTSSEIYHSKDKHLEAQLHKVFNSFYEYPKTMKEVDRETGIMRESICRYCRTLRLQNKLFPVLKRRCKVTNYPTVIAWTTNPELAPGAKQLALFKEE